MEAVKIIKAHVLNQQSQLFHSKAENEKRTTTAVNDRSVHTSLDASNRIENEKRTTTVVNDGSVHTSLDASNRIENETRTTTVVNDRSVHTSLDEAQWLRSCLEHLLAATIIEIVRTSEPHWRPACSNVCSDFSVVVSLF